MEKNLMCFVSCKKARMLTCKEEKAFKVICLLACSN